MHRDDKSKFLLYIEPNMEDKLVNPIEDGLTKLMEMALSKAKSGTAGYSRLDDLGDGFDFNGRKLPSFREGSGYKGTHTAPCGERSSNNDYLLENGMITNSLAPFYLKWYRFSIPENDMLKLKELSKFYNYEL